jgi:hypothetical protein
MCLKTDQIALLFRTSPALEFLSFQDFRRVPSTPLHLPIFIPYYPAVGLEINRSLKW